MEHVWKVGDKGVFIGDDCHYFTKGKVYEVVDGVDSCNQILFTTDNDEFYGWNIGYTDRFFNRLGNASEWTDKHYDNKYQLSEENIKNGFINLDVYFVSKQWKIGSRDESGALWHCLKTIARFGDKNSKEREIKALYAQIKCLAKLEGVDLD